MCADYESVSDKARLKAHIGTNLHRFSMLTINADAQPADEPVLRAHDEKRMIVILPPERYDLLRANAKDSGAFLQAWPTELLAADVSQQTLSF